ncbi:MAG: GNAT family N-acetyltransferase [Candidatus Cloacimonetes bacterium]|nr:GNAT family N-acetyltransferase [Candidatus Cloacimonadota bacterium]
MRHIFNLQDCQVRLAKTEDTEDLISIARGIWGGSDYLPRILPRWLQEPYFFVCEYQGRVIACIKLSLFPDNVLWFEGLRVHARFQGKGVGKLMNREMFRFAASLKAKNPLLTFEFCTYYKNTESLHITKQAGFEVVKQFYTVDKHGIKKQSEPVIMKDYDLTLFNIYPDYIPCGWQSVHNCPEALDFIQKRCIVFETNQARYLHAGLAEKNIILLSPPPKDIQAELPFFQSFYTPLKKYGLILPLNYRAYLPKLKKAGFRFWDNETKPVKNMLVLKMKQAV